MSIIDDALRKAREKRDTEIQEPQKPLSAPLPKEDAPPGKPKPEIPEYKPETPEYSTKETPGLNGNKKVFLRHILFAIGVMVIISFGLNIIIKQNIKRRIDRPLATQEEYKAPPEPLKAIPRKAPSVKPSPTLSERSEFSLTGIIYDEDSSMAIINGEVYMVGDKVKTAKILKIFENMVVLERDGKRIELQVK